MLLFAFFLTLLAIVDSQYQTEICEKQEHRLKCEGKATLSINKAIYGRRNRNICVTNPGEQSNVNCHADVSCFAMKVCDGKNHCKLNASNAIFVDPCPGTSKYLKVGFQCHHTDIACEGKTMHLKCNGSGKIRINHAIYGRTDKKQKCLDHTGTKDLCFVMDASAVASSKCNGKSSCKILVEESIFNKNNVFIDVSKYLEIKYACHS